MYALETGFAGSWFGFDVVGVGGWLISRSPL